MRETLCCMLEVLQQKRAGRAKIEEFLKTIHDLQGSRDRRAEALLELVIHLCTGGHLSSARDIVLMVLRWHGLAKRIRFQFLSLAGLIEHRAILGSIEGKAHRRGATINTKDGRPVIGFKSAPELINNSMKADLVSAKIHLRNAIDVIPDAVSIGYALVHLETIDGNWQSARNTSRLLAKAAPNDRDAHLLKAGILGTGGPKKCGSKSEAKAFAATMQCDPYAVAAVNGLLSIARLKNVSKKCQGWIIRGLMRHLEVCHPLHRMPLAPECWRVLAQCLVRMAQDRLKNRKKGVWDNLQPVLDDASSWWGRYHFLTPQPQMHAYMDIERLMLRDKAVCAAFILGHNNQYTDWASTAMRSENLDIIVAAMEAAKKLNRQCDCSVLGIS